MGFNFSRGGGSGGGGGTIRRKPFRNYTAAFYGSKIQFEGSGLTSPTAILSSPSIPLTTRLNNAFTYLSDSQSNTTMTFYFSIPSTYWVDLFGFVGDLYTTVEADGTLHLNGASFNPTFFLRTDYWGRIFDVASYGLDLTWTVYQTGDFFFRAFGGPIAPRTIIDQNGSIVIPEALSGQTVVTDIQT